MFSPPPALKLTLPSSACPFPFKHVSPHPNATHHRSALRNATTLKPNNQTQSSHLFSQLGRTETVTTMSTETPPNFWGYMPEEEYYASQRVANTKPYFETPNGKIFAQRFFPLDRKVKASVCMTHGYGSDTGWLFQKICISFTTWGYAVFAADLLGHGRSD